MRRVHKKAISRLLFWLKLFGIDVRKFLRSLGNLSWFVKTLKRYTRLANNGMTEATRLTLYPCLLDRTDTAGSARGHYFWQDLYVAQKIHAENPDKHVDVGSRFDGFVTHVASFRHLTVLDIRQLDSDVPNVSFEQLDLMEFDPRFESYADSVSCLHVIEHFGLGRYGDSIDPHGHLRGLKNIARIVKPGGTLYLAFPAGKEKVEFNAHRVLSIASILTTLPNFSFVEGMLIDDSDSRAFFTHSQSRDLIAMAEKQELGCAVLVLKTA